MGTVRIPLSKGQYAVIDEEDHARVAVHRWHVMTRRRTSYGESRIDGRTVLLHRFLLDAPPGLQVDHVDGDGLNCTRANLRLCSVRENAHNRSRSPRNTSGYKGVFRDGRRWRAQIMEHQRGVSLGTFGTPEEAARAYDQAARERFGEFARTNESMGLL